VSTLHAGRLNRPRRALIDAVRVAVQHRSQRGLADDWIRAGREARPNRFDWRIRQLTAPGERRLLARSLRRVVADLAPGAHPEIAPNREALRPHLDRLEMLAERLDDTERPVSAAGILAVRDLLTDPHSPLFSVDGADTEVRAGESLRLALEALEVS
jgi:hypothetical protein